MKRFSEVPSMIVFGLIICLAFVMGTVSYAVGRFASSADEAVRFSNLPLKVILTLLAAINVLRIALMVVVGIVVVAITPAIAIIGGLVWLACIVWDNAAMAWHDYTNDAQPTLA